MLSTLGGEYGKAPWLNRASALLNVEQRAMTGIVTDNEIKIALGECGDVWPASIRPTAARAALMNSLISRNALH
jgi:hypothetical protein